MDHGGSHVMRCSMNMVWNTDPTGICLVFPSLQITGPLSLLLALAFLTLLSIAFEWTRLYTTSTDRALRASLCTRTAPARSRSPEPSGSEEGLLGRGARWTRVKLPVGVQARRSLVYGAQVAVSFYLMLIVMTYNAVLIGAVVVGAILGHFLFQRELDVGGGDEDGKGLLCH